MKILIVKTSSLGDIIHAFPVLQHLRKCYPDAQIDWVVEEDFAPLVEAHPYLNQAIKINTKKWRKSFLKKEVRHEFKQFRQKLQLSHYDLLIDLQANLKSGLINSLVTSSKKVGFGARTVHEWPNLFFTTHRYNPLPGKNIREDYLYLAQSVTGNFSQEIKGIKLNLSEADQQKVNKNRAHLNLNGNGPVVMVCTGSNWPNKQLGKETLLAFLSLIASNLNSRFIFVWGNEEEKQVSEELAKKIPGKACVAEKMGLAALQNLMADVDLVLAMDSLPLHLVATTPTPIYSVFGASSAAKFKPSGESHEAFQGVCPFGKTFVKRCSILRTCSTGACVKDIEAEKLFHHFNQFVIRLKW